MAEKMTSSSGYFNKKMLAILEKGEKPKAEKKPSKPAQKKGK